MKEEVYQEWFSRKNLAKGTQENYKIVLESYQKFVGKDLEALLDEAEEDEETISRIRKRKINKYIFSFKVHLEEKGYAPGTIHNKMSAILSFYKAFDIQLPQIELPKGDVGLEKNCTKLISKQELQKMLDVANGRDRAIIYLLALTGLAQNEARHLTIKKFIDAASEAIGKNINNINDLFEYEDLILEEILILVITRQKTNYRHHTFIPPEVSRSIIAYLKERCYNRNDKRHINDLNTPIFITNKGDPMSKSGITTAIRRVGNIAGFKSEKGAHSFWKPHAARKYFESTIINKTGDHLLADYLVGHQINRVTRAYWIADPEQLKERYLKILPFISLDGIKVKNYESPEFRKMQEQMDAVTTQIQELLEEKELCNELMGDREFMNYYSRL